MKAPTWDFEDMAALPSHCCSIQTCNVLSFTLPSSSAWYLTLRHASESSLWGWATLHYLKASSKHLCPPCKTGEHIHPLLLQHFGIPGQFGVTHPCTHQFPVIPPAGAEHISTCLCANTKHGAESNGFPCLSVPCLPDMKQSAAGGDGFLAGDMSSSSWKREWNCCVKTWEAVLCIFWGWPLHFCYCL